MNHKFTVTIKDGDKEVKTLEVKHGINGEFSAYDLANAVEAHLFKQAVSDVIQDEIYFGRTEQRIEDEKTSNI